MKNTTTINITAGQLIFMYMVVLKMSIEMALWRIRLR